MGTNFTNKTISAGTISAGTLHSTNSYGILRGVADELDIREIPLSDRGVCRLGLSVSDHTTLTDEMLNRMIVGVWPKTTPNSIKAPEIERVIHHDPATIVYWTDGTKTVVKVQDGEVFDKEKGFAMAVLKKMFGNKGNYYNEIRKWVK